MFQKGFVGSGGPGKRVILGPFQCVLRDKKVIFSENFFFRPMGSKCSQMCWKEGFWFQKCSTVPRGPVRGHGAPPRELGGKIVEKKFSPDVFQMF